MSNALAFVAIGLLMGSIVAGFVTYRVTKREHQSREYALTWALGIGALFLMGIGPAVVGLGLHLTVERNYPMYWLLSLVVAGVLAMFGLGMAITTVDLAVSTDPLLFAIG